MLRKMVLSVAVTMLVLPAFASAQSSQVTATATVGNYSLVSGSGDLAFGTLDRTADNVIVAAGGAGSAARTVDFNHNITITYANVPANLTSGALLLPVSLTCASRLGAGAWSASAACTSASFDLDVGAALTQGTLGFGGTITGADVANAVAATYSGTFDIVVTAR